MGLSSLILTGFLSDNSSTPLGTISGGRALPVGFSTVVPGGRFLGVPTKRGLGRSSFNSTRSSFLGSSAWVTVRIALSARAAMQSNGGIDRMVHNYHFPAV